MIHKRKIKEVYMYNKWGFDAWSDDFLLTSRWRGDSHSVMVFSVQLERSPHVKRTSQRFAESRGFSYVSSQREVLYGWLGDTGQSN